MTDPTPTVRRATAEDAGRVAELFDAYRVFYGQTPAPDAARAFVHDRIDKADSAIFVAEDGGEIKGFAQLYPSMSSVAMGPIWVLNDLYVDESARGKGLATALLERVQAFAEENGASRLTLATARDNRAAAELYRKMGWRPDEFFVTYHRLINA